jgi:hypothetical protein
VERNPADTFALVEAKPLAQLDRDREVLLLWADTPPAEPPADQPSKPAATESKPAAEIATATPAQATPAPPAARPQSQSQPTQD